MRNRFTGFLISGLIFPRMSSVISTGTSVTPRNDAKNIEGFCKGERPEEPALLCGQRKDRDKAYCDHKQSKKQRASDAFRAGDNHLNTLDVVRLALVGFPEMLELLMRILDHHDRGIDHGTNGDSDAAQRHDVRGHMHPPHRDERQNDRDRQRDDRHQRRSDMPEKNQTDQRDDNAFFDQLLTQGGDGAANQVAAIVGWYDSYTGWQRRLYFLDFLFDSI